MEDLLPAVLEIAVAAGDEIMRIYNRAGAASVEYKEGGSPLTEADRAAHELIVRRLAELPVVFPVLSEESDELDGQDRLSWARYWLVDPLDGTKEFIRRNGEFTVNIALIERGAPVLGVVYAPALDKAYWAARGVGAYSRCAGQAAVAIHVGSADAEPRRVVASRSHSDAKTEAFLNKLGRYELASVGSSLKLCLVAENGADVYPRFGPTMEWDTAAAQCVVECAGGVVCDFEGRPLQYNKADLLNPGFAVMPAGMKDWVVGKVRESVLM
ncbi:MAG: 3'(2'),5'-bisphosphate nucleotidase CysQ [Nitrosomonadales bacterium]|nr:3'(2'),5'-bisphosphate nucleotidase CysQ [Nitrosomonadales bacterium]